MPGPLFDAKSRPMYHKLYARLFAEMNAAGEITDLRPWFTRAAELYEELRCQGTPVDGPHPTRTRPATATPDESESSGS